MYIDYEKYKNGGWGLSRSCLNDIASVIKFMEDEIADRPLNILEFGSGDSTRFLVDNFSRHNIESYDNDAKYAFKHESVRIRDLITCDDSSYNKMFGDGIYNRELMVPHPHEVVHTRQKNCFYDFEHDDLQKEFYDVVIIDGPNGNGRNFAFLHLMNKLRPGTCIIFDDQCDYNFKETMFNIIKKEIEIISDVKNGRVNKWVSGGDYFVAYIT